jgi:flagellar motor switch protein FliN/FliY
VIPEEPEMPELGGDELLELPLRVWAEIGRTRMPASTIVGMPRGTIVDLDREPDEPADIYVNGRHLGTGRILLVEGEWAVRVETLDDIAEGIEQVSSGDQPGEQPTD